jgi:hypothetical protein
MQSETGKTRIDASGEPSELTTVLTTMTTVRLPDTSPYGTVELESCLRTPLARAYGSEG